jgi:GT2 family glycosyltransferase
MRILKKENRRKKMPKVSIILPLYNSERFVEECIDSLINQSFKDFELIILDDCSTDNTLEIIRKENTLTNGMTGIRVILNEKNLGFPKNVNKGILMAEGDFVMIADHDMVYDKDYLKSIIEEDKDISAGKVYYYKEKEKIRCFGLEINGITGKTKVAGRDQIDNGQIYPKEISAAPAGALVIKREVFSNVGLLNEDLNKYYIDVDFCLMARRKGYKINLANAKVWHKKEEKENFDKKHLEEYYEDKIKFLKKFSLFYPLSILLIKLKSVISK